MCQEVQQTRALCPWVTCVSLFVCNDGYTELIALLLALAAHPAHSMENAMQMVVSRSAFAKAALPGKRAVRCASVYGRGACYPNPLETQSVHAATDGMVGNAKIPCPKGCSDNGKCVNGSCVCDAEWSGEDCATRSLHAIVPGKVLALAHPRSYLPIRLYWR